MGPITVDLSGVVFDWDGTVVDSRLAMFLSHRFAYQTHLGIEFPRDEAEFRSMVAMRTQESAAMYGGDKAAEIAQAYDYWYNTHAYARTRVFPGMLSAIERLKSRGYAVAVASNKGLGRVLKDMDHLGLNGVFDVLVTAEDTPERKPHPAPLLKTAEKLGLAPSRCAYVGDFPGDVVAAKAAGMVAIGVTWGRIYPEDQLRAEEPDHLLERPEQLLEICPDRRAMRTR